MVTNGRVWYNILNTRNIKAREEFYVYFIELLHIIREGPLMKYRINKKTAKKIEEDILSRNYGWTIKFALSILSDVFALELTL